MLFLPGCLSCPDICANQSGGSRAASIKEECLLPSRHDVGQLLAFHLLSSRESLLLAPWLCCIHPTRPLDYRYFLSLLDKCHEVLRTWSTVLCVVGATSDCAERIVKRDKIPQSTTERFVRQHLWSRIPGKTAGSKPPFSPSGENRKASFRAGEWAADYYLLDSIPEIGLRC